MAYQESPIIYSRLDHPRAFRVLVLAPGADDAPICCQLQIETIPNHLHPANRIVYDALSYAWGDDAPTHEIQLGAWHLNIKDNLWHFLRHHRHTSDRRVLWIDALCINQAQLDERACQVQLMDQIFRGARHVLVWPAQPDANSTAVANVIQRFDTGLTAITQSEHASLAIWSRQPYWSRAWVVQEFVLESSMLLLCGPVTLAWPIFRRFLEQVQVITRFASGTRQSIWNSFIGSPAELLMQQRADYGIKPKKLGDLLVHNQHAESLDPRDKIYAMLGLATDTEALPKITVSYRMHILQLIEETIAHCGVSDKNLIRFVHFLLLALKVPAKTITPSSEPRAAMTGAQRQTKLTPTYATGEIVDCVPLAEGTSSLNAQTLQAARNLSHLDTEQIASAINRLCQLDTSTLVPNPMLGRLSQRLAPNAPTRTSTSGTRHSASPVQYLVVIYTAHCVRPELLMGIATGSPAKGDTMLSFLGHDTSFSAQPRPTGVQLTGRMLLLKSEGSGRSHDMVTRAVPQGFAIQSEISCREPIDRVELDLGFDEILVLAQ